MKTICAGLLLASFSLAPALAAAPLPIKHPPPPVKRVVCALKGDGSRADYPADMDATAAGAKVLHMGYCEAAGKEPAMCNMLYKPVCATESGSGKEKTYPNLCHAETANAKLLHDGECQPAKSDLPPG